MKYVHTNIITDDWKRLAEFYIQAFSCKMTLPHRNLSGDWLSKATGVKNAHIKGAHLRLPGWGKQGPTLEIFQYHNNEAQPHPLSNRKGLGHLAFEVEDVEAALEQALAFGGERYGEVVVHQTEQMGTLTFVYLRDPDGNIIELQNWGKPIHIPLEELGKKVPAKHTTDDTPKPLKEKTQPPTKEQELPNTSKQPTPVEPLTNGQEEEEYLDPNLDKRGFLDALQKDLDSTKQSVRDAKAEIKASREDADYHQQQVNKKLKYIPDEDRTIKKDKQELLQELKGEMEKEDLDKRALPVQEKTSTPPQKEQPASTPSTLALPKEPAQLQVEFKMGEQVEIEALTQEQLGMPPQQLAHNLRALTTVAHPENKELSFLEYLGKQYRADLVPLVKALKANQNRIEKEKAWALLPRLKGSIHHLLGQCQEQSSTLENLGLEQLGLSPKEFIATYESLMKVVELAEQKAAAYVRFSYTLTLSQ